MSLKTDYKNAIPTTPLRKYLQVDNGDGTISLRDVTTYTQEGDNFGAADINATNIQANTHAARHGSSGADPLTPADIGAAAASHASSHASDGADPIPPASIGAAVVRRFTANIPATWTATPAVAAETTVESGSVDVAQADFSAAVNTPGTYTFTYDGANAYWTLDAAEVSLAAYGVTLAGAPADADTVTVSYTETAPYTQQIVVAGMTADMRPKCDILFDDEDALEERVAQKESWLCVDDVDSGAGMVALTCFEAAPETAFIMQMEVTA